MGEQKIDYLAHEAVSYDVWYWCGICILMNYLLLTLIDVMHKLTTNLSVSTGCKVWSAQCQVACKRRVQDIHNLT